MQAMTSAIFPDWNADPEKPESYHFGAVRQVRPFDPECARRSLLPHRPQLWRGLYRPLPDFDKFASVVKHIAMHYNQGWANGFHDNIRYWEFWNEPDLPFFWTETPERFYQLYEKTARALKSVDPAMKVGAERPGAGLQQWSLSRGIGRLLRQPPRPARFLFLALLRHDVG